MNHKDPIFDSPCEHSWVWSSAEKCRVCRLCLVRLEVQGLPAGVFKALLEMAPLFDLQKPPAKYRRALIDHRKGS